MLRPSIQIVTHKPVAFDSPDHTLPHGTARDNSTNQLFNKKLKRLIPISQLRVLDLGCSGGGFVKSVLDQGGLAVGIEGSDYSKVRKRAEWATIPEYLFTADITEPFFLFEQDACGQERLMQFNVITAWEVIEHIRQSKLEDVLKNIKRHLMPGGLIIMSISPNEEIIQGITLHQTVASQDWWLARFAELGFTHHAALVDYFGCDWVRTEYDAPGSFYAALTRQNEALPFADELPQLAHAAMPANWLRRQWLYTRIFWRGVKARLYPITPTPLKQAYRRWRDRTRTRREHRDL